jgi:photosystem II stability/assembly factor-like uncharacterized protein
VTRITEFAAVVALCVAFESSAGSAVGGWIPQLVPSPDGTVQEVVFPQERTGWICGFFAGVLRTTDGGSTWSELKANLPKEKIGAIWFLDRTRGWAVATSYAREQPQQLILFSADGGASWAVRERVEGVAHLVSIWFLNERLGWAVGGRENEPLILRTIDGGGTWRESYVGAGLTSEIRRVRFADAQHGWAVGPRAILYTSDGGSTWNPQFNSADGVWLNELAVLGPG